MKLLSVQARGEASNANMAKKTYKEMYEPNNKIVINNSLNSPNKFA